MYIKTYKIHMWEIHNEYISKFLHLERWFIWPMVVAVVGLHWSASPLGALGPEHWVVDWRRWWWWGRRYWYPGWRNNVVPWLQWVVVTSLSWHVSSTSVSVLLPWTACILASSMTWIAWSQWSHLKNQLHMNHNWHIFKYYKDTLLLLL